MRENEKECETKESDSVHVGYYPGRVVKIKIRKAKSKSEKKPRVYNKYNK